MKSESNPHSFSAGLTAALLFLNRAFALRSHNNLQFHGVFVAFRARDGLQLTISRLTGENKPAWRDHDLTPPCCHHRCYRRALQWRVCVKGRPPSPPPNMQFTSGQLALEQKQTRQWHMWLRGERCRRPPDDEGDEGECRARCLRGVCGGRVACGRRTRARSGLLGVVLHHLLVSYGLAEQRQLKGGSSSRSPVPTEWDT